VTEGAYPRYFLYECANEGLIFGRVKKRGKECKRGKPPD